MSDDRNERLRFALQAFVIMCEEAGGIDQPPDELRRIAHKTIVICNDDPLFQNKPLHSGELKEALRAGRQLITEKAEELRRATDAWEKSFPRRRVLNRIIEQLWSG